LPHGNAAYIKGQPLNRSDLACRDVVQGLLKIWLSEDLAF
jgi:hypothetical protein